ncbi:hypothetical protein PAE4_40376 [Bacillus altitudinis]|nr:hypothetical protein PAE4_40376 [Bacillus altitudinis]
MIFGYNKTIGIECIHYPYWANEQLAIDDAVNFITDPLERCTVLDPVDNS